MMSHRMYRPESLTIEPRPLVAYLLQRLLDHDPDHPLAPEVTEVGVVEGFGGLGGELRGFPDRLRFQPAAFQESFSGRRLDRVRGDSREDDAAFADCIPVEHHSNRG